MLRSFNLTPILAALTLALALLLAGCGPSDNTPATPAVEAPTATAAITLEAPPVPTLATPSTRVPDADPGAQDVATPPSDQPAPATATPTQTPALEIPSAPTADIPTERLVETPLRINIPAIGIETTVEWVGLDAEGNMDVPSRYDTTAWFEHGVRPGMTGNAVIAGHFDSRGGPAVFFRLQAVQPGDEIQITTSDGELLTFRVDRIASFDANNAPRYEIFGPSTQPRLNLITCSGVFDSAAGAYNERLVVYSTLVSATGG